MISIGYVIGLVLAFVVFVLIFIFSILWHHLSRRDTDDEEDLPFEDNDYDEEAEDKKRKKRLGFLATVDKCYFIWKHRVEADYEYPNNFFVDDGFDSLDNRSNGMHCDDILEYYEDIKKDSNLFIDRGITDGHISDILCDYANDRNMDIFKIRINEYCRDGEFDYYFDETDIADEELVSSVILDYGVRLDIFCPRCYSCVKYKADHLKKNVVWDTLEDVENMGEDPKNWTCKR